MKLNEIFLEEFKDEMKTTRTFLELLFNDFFEYSPHEKSMNLLNLVNHMLPIYTWIPKIIEHTELDWSKETPPIAMKSRETILKQFDENVAIAEKALLATNNDQLSENWTMRSGDTILFTGLKRTAVRRYVLNHIVHHRAQLGIYLRVTNDIVPGSYVKSADQILF